MTCRLSDAISSVAGVNGGLGDRGTPELRTRMGERKGGDASGAGLEISQVSGSGNPYDFNGFRAPPGSRPTASIVIDALGSRMHQGSSAWPRYNYYGKSGCLSGPSQI